MANILYWVLAIFMFGMLIMLHEFGHFIAARLTGVTVIEFAIGFGPKILSRKAKSGIRYSWRLLPFGGYCRFAGEETSSEALEEDPDTPRPERIYPEEKIWKRALISFCGPLMNVLSAFVLLFLLYFAIGLPIGLEPVVDTLLPDLPAQEAGMQAGDRILAINGIEITDTEQASQIISASEGNTVEFTLERGGETLTLSVQPQWVEDEDPPRYMIGIQYRYGLQGVTFGFVDSVKSAFLMTGQMARLIVDVLKDLITTGEGMDDLAGPIGTITLVKQQTQSGGLFNYVYLASMININIGLFNLLPIPGLDGSKLLFLLIEKIRGKPLDPNKEGIVTLIGFAFLMGLMVLALYQDIARLVG